MKLVSIYSIPRPIAANALYKLLAERPVETRISHESMPTRFQHEAFIRSKPFRYWFLILVGEIYVGAIECTKLNEVGIAIYKAHHGKGYATAALKLFMATRKPLRPIPARRNARWLANISMGNHVSESFFRKLGFHPIQTTYALRREA